MRYEKDNATVPINIACMLWKFDSAEIGSLVGHETGFARIGSVFFCRTMAKTVPEIMESIQSHMSWFRFLINIRPVVRRMSRTNAWKKLKQQHLSDAGRKPWISCKFPEPNNYHIIDEPMKRDTLALANAIAWRLCQVGQLIASGRVKTATLSRRFANIYTEMCNT